MKILFYFFIITLFSCRQYDEIKVISKNSSSTYKNQSLKDSSNFSWNSGKKGIDWIEFEIEKHKRINRISFFVHSSPPNFYLINILTNQIGKTYFESIYMKKTRSIDIDTVSYDVDFYLSNVSKIRIELKNDLSWNSISNIKIEGSK